MLLVSIVLSLAITQAPHGPFEPCPPPSPFPGRPYFDFQVSQPAVYLGTDSTSVRPDATQHRSAPYPSDFVLAQFVVDSLGAPIPGTLKLLVEPTGFPVETLSFAITEWRYRPARIDTCRVAQVVQTPLRWK